MASLTLNPWCWLEIERGTKKKAFLRLSNVLVSDLALSLSRTECKGRKQKFKSDERKCQHRALSSTDGIFDLERETDRACVFVSSGNLSSNPSFVCMCVLALRVSKSSSSMIDSSSSTIFMSLKVCVVNSWIQRIALSPYFEFGLIIIHVVLHELLTVFWEA